MSGTIDEKLDRMQKQKKEDIGKALNMENGGR